MVIWFGWCFGASNPNRELPDSNVSAERYPAAAAHVHLAGQLGHGHHSFSSMLMLRGVHMARVSRSACMRAGGSAAWLAVWRAGAKLQRGWQHG